MSFWKNLFEQYQNYLEKTVEERRLLEQQNQQNQNENHIVASTKENNINTGNTKNEEKKTEEPKNEIPTQFQVLKNCLDSIHNDVAEKRYESAIQTLQNYYRDNFADAQLDDIYVEMLEAVENKLKTSIGKRIEDAKLRNQFQEIGRLSLLYPPLGMKEEGIKIYSSNFIVPYIQEHGRLVLEDLNVYIEKQRKLAASTSHPNSPFSNKKNDEKENKKEEEEEDLTNLTDFVAALRSLFEFQAAFIEENKEKMEKAFGKEESNGLLKILFIQGDFHSTKIFETFFGFIKIQETLIKINEFKSSNEKSRNNYVDLRDINEMAEQMSMISHISEVFDSFLKKKLSFPFSFARQNYIKEVIAYYNILEEYFMSESSRKAFLVDKFEKTAKLSTFVDTTFYILKKCTMRALTTSNCTSSCSILNMLNNILTLEYKTIIVKMLRSSFEQDQPNINPLYALNNVEVSSENIKKLHAALLQESESIFSDSPKDIEKIKLCLGEILIVAKSFKEDILMRYLEEVASRIYPRLQAYLSRDGFDSCNYDLTEVQFEACEVNDPFISNFLVSFNELVDRYKTNFTENNFQYLMSLVLDFLAKEIEKRVWKKHFSLLGGIQFNKELKILLDYCSENIGRSSRNKFSRLTQMVSILNVEKVNDAKELWESTTNIQWKLTPQEFIQVLKLRTDLSKVDIQKINLS